MTRPARCKEKNPISSDLVVQRQEETSDLDKKYRLLFEKSQDAILIIENQMFTDCNQAAVDMLGYESKANLLNTHPSQLSPEFQPDGRESFKKAKEMIDVALQNGSHRFEWNHVRSNGNVFPVEVVLTAISNEKDKEILHTIWRDITHQKTIEKDREREQEKLRMILESIPHGVSLVNNLGEYQYVNSHFTKITGYSIDDIPNKQAWFKRAYPDPVYRKKVMDTWTTDSERTGPGEYREFEISCRDGNSKHIEFRSTFLEDLKISVLTDVTDRKNSEEMIREKDRLQGVLELSGAVCHEMNQPLMSIQGYFELLTMDIDTDSPIHDKILKIQMQIKRLTGITKKLMEISRYETKDYMHEKIVDIEKSSNNVEC